MFIKEAIENPAKISLITMPRRSGKSANMDTLKRFLSIDHDVDFNQRLFQQKIKTLPDGTKSQLNISKSTLLLIDETKIGKYKEIKALEQAKTYAPLIEESRDKVFIALNITDRKEITSAIEVVTSF